MEHAFQPPDKGAQVSGNKTRKLRGYDPLREIYQWNLVSLLCFSEVLCVGSASWPTFNSAFMLAEGTIWGIRPGTLVPLFLLLGTIPFLFMYECYREERQARARLRRKSLMLHESDHASVQVQPSSALQPLPLPMQIESRRKRSFTIRVALAIFLLAVSLVANYTIILANHAEPLFLYAAVPSLLATTMIGLSAAIWIEMRLRIAGCYLLPSLAIDGESITACYGRDTITIKWRDIRYFALVNSLTLRQLPTSNNPPTLRQLLKSGRTSSKPSVPAHEVFEISDGENVICWLKAAPFRNHRLCRFGEVVLSDQDYIAFTQQLAALIVERTGLPLYDLRFAKYKS